MKTQDHIYQSYVWKRKISRWSCALLIKKKNCMYSLDYPSSI